MGWTERMRVLVTGAAGFIGSTIVDLLRLEGHEVLAVDLLLDRAHRSRPAWVDDGLHVVDVRDESRLAGLLRGVDAVCHQAAMVGLGLTIHDAPDYASHNVVGTATLVSAMTRAGVNDLVQASSMVVYGGGRAVCPVHGDVATRPRAIEDLASGRFEPRCAVCGEQVTWALVGEGAPLKPHNAYAATKLAQEHLAIAWSEQSGGRAISLRYHNVTPRSDLYSLGVVGHELLTGAKPFDKGTPIATALAHLEDQPPPLPADTPNDLAGVITSCLAKDPAQRPDSAGAIVTVLARSLPPLAAALLDGGAGTWSPAEASGPASTQGWVPTWGRLPNH